MNYTYKLKPNLPDGTPQQSVKRSDGWSIPFSKGNTMYQEYLAWLAEGNTPQPADEPAE